MRFFTVTTGRFILPLFLALTFVSSMLIGQPSEGTGTIRGTVNISQSDDISAEISRGRSLNRYEANGANSEKSLPPYALWEKAVIYLESVPGKYSPPETHPALDQRDMVFRPLVLPILAGTTVDFPNSDPLFHNVFSLSQAKEFDLGRYPKGQKKSVTFDRAGIVSVYCEIHSYMFATILVLGNPFFTVPSEDGTYSLKNIPTGNYKLSFWFGRKKVETRSVTVSAGEQTTANFTY